MGELRKAHVEVNELYNIQSAQHVDWISICMSRDRFKLLCCTICFDDGDTRNEREQMNKKFHKFDEIFNHFKTKLQSGLKPSSNTCIDEQLYKYRGRCPFNTYHQNQPNMGLNIGHGFA